MNEALCEVLIILALPNRAPALELVIRQPMYDQSSVTSPRPIKAAWPTTGISTSTACPADPLWVTVTSRKSDSKLCDLLPVTV